MNALTDYFKPQTKEQPVHAPVTYVSDKGYVAALSRQYSRPPAAIDSLMRQMTSADLQPFIAKYQPKTDCELFDRDTVTALTDFLTSFQPASTPQAVLLTGPAGCGKTSLVRAVTRSLGLLLMEMGTKEPRHSQALLRVLGEATQTRKIEAISKTSVVLLDDVDVIFDCDKGFYKTVSDLISRTKLPLLMTAVTPPEELVHRGDVAELRMAQITEYEGTLKMRIINRAENLKIPEYAIRPLFWFQGENMGRVLNAMQVEKLDLIFGLQMPVTGLSISEGEVHASSIDANWLADTSEHNFEPRLDFVHRNQDCVSFPGLDEFSTYCDVLSQYDCMVARMSESVQREKDGENTESQEKYGLRQCMQYLDELTTRNLTVSKAVKLWCYDPPLCVPTSQGHKRPPRRAKKRPSELNLDSV